MLAHVFALIFSVLALNDSFVAPFGQRSHHHHSNRGSKTQPHLVTSDTSSSSPTASSGHDGDDRYQPYAGEQPAEALPEIFINQVMPKIGKLDDGFDEELLWVPQTDCVSFRPLCLCVSSGYYVNLLRVRGAGLLSRHRHPGPVHGYVLKGNFTV